MQGSCLLALPTDELEYREMNWRIKARSPSALALFPPEFSLAILTNRRGRDLHERLGGPSHNAGY
jgi:hypothetical protein